MKQLKSPLYILIIHGSWTHMNIFIWQFAVHWLTTPHLPKLLFMLSCISFLCSYRQFCFYIHVMYIGMILCFKLGATNKRKQSLSFWHGLTHLKWWCPVVATAFHNSQSFILYCIFVLFYMCLCIYVMKYNAHMIIHIPLCMFYIYIYVYNIFFMNFTVVGHQSWFHN